MKAERNLVKTKTIKFIGYSGSGKTTLIEKIVKKLSDEGVRVATIKHDVHGLDIDKEGKDSYRYSEAGAQVSAVSSPEMTVYKIHKSLSLDEIISNVKDVDFIIVEGYSSDGKLPTISVARKETGKGVKGDLDSLVAVVSDYNEHELKDLGYKGQAFKLNDIERIIEFIRGDI